MKTITTHAIIEGIRARKDRSLGLSITTPELTPPEKTLFMELQGINTKLTIEPLDEQNIEQYTVDQDLKQQPQSVRMRSVLFILWKQKPDGLEFNDYYMKKTEQIIEYLKGKIEDES